MTSRGQYVLLSKMKTHRLAYTCNSFLNKIYIYKTVSCHHSRISVITGFDQKRDVDKKKKSAHPINRKGTLEYDPIVIKHLYIT